MDEITWSDSTRKLRDLIPQEDNPREIERDQAERLVKSWHKFGQPDVISIGPDNRIYNGHQRYRVWGAAYGMDCEVAVRVSSRELTRAEWQELTVLMHEGTVGRWDWDALANWEDVDTDDLTEWVFDIDTLLGAWFDVDEGDTIPDPEYTRKIEAPIYEPTGKKPDISELVDTAKFSELVQKIESSDLDNATKDFLRFAAYRHCVFDYEKIAEFYAHSDKDVQELMEASALVIIDFDAAIENGFVKLSHEIAEIYRQDHGNG